MVFAKEALTLSFGIHESVMFHVKNKPSIMFPTIPHLPSPNSTNSSNTDLNTNPTDTEMPCVKPTPLSTTPRHR